MKMNFGPSPAGISVIRQYPLTFACQWMAEAVRQSMEKANPIGIVEKAIEYPPRT
jgi:hypothetical protein